ncbi:peptidase, M50 family protein [Rhodopirellula maiorica SM1]|uniref:Peptidase, M50 family protein n=1 Tax=Rhodopirellula maiorica SM1 TaxID=1265738 RepID=M5RJT2_9BACT|nr:efflux RND transporter periplasmic adaptor subunit [Rhodopirellula maiorica]EMI15637.1 peptidase, M50 family protein [Rhodopirellula maiorica SM1]
MSSDADLPSIPTVILDPEVTFIAREIGGRTTYVSHHEATGKFFQLGPEEYRVASLLDGVRGIPELFNALHSEGVEWTTEDLAKFIAQLVQANVAVIKQGSAEPTESPIEDAAATGENPDQASTDPASYDAITDAAPRSPEPPRPGLLTMLLRFLPWLISQRFPLFRGDRIATRLTRYLGPAFEPIGFSIWMLLVFSGLCVVYGHFEAFAAELRRMFDPGLWPMLFLIWIVAKLVHEAGHAVAAKHHGVRVGQVGIMFFLLAPLAYVDVTDAWKLRRRFYRVQIALGGVYFELAVAAVAAWAWWFLPEGYAKHITAQFFLISGPATLLVNANPLLRLDGYYVLSDLTEIPNLRMHGRRQLGSVLQRLFFGIPQTRQLLSGWRVWFASIHAACSVVFQVFWMGGLVLGVAMWARGLGILLAIAGVLMWFLIPAVRWVWKIWMLEPGERFGLNFYRRRMLFYASLLIALFQQLSTVSSPFDRRVPVVVRFQDEQIARSPSDAFVESLFVERGQHVEQGTLLMRLKDPELRIKREKKADDLEIAELKAIQYRRQGELSKAATSLENANALRRQIAEMDEQIAQLTVVANRSGYIVGNQVESLPGRFVAAGQELLRVSDPQEKELLAVVPEQDVDAYQLACQNDSSSRVRLRGGLTIKAKPASLRPRASRMLVHPALAANVGGPLVVEPTLDGSGEMRLAQPYLESITKLDPITSAEVRSGQLGSMTIRDNRPVLARVYDAIATDFRRLGRSQ